MDIRSSLIYSSMAAVIVVIVSVMIEHLGARFGGILGTVPHVIIMGVAGLYTQLSIPEFRLAMFGIPIGSLGNGVYLGIILLGSHKLKFKLSVISRLKVLICSALASFAGFLSVMQLIFDIFKQTEAGAWVISIGCSIVQLFLGLWFCRLHPAAPVDEQHLRVCDLLTRAIVTFSVFMFSLWLATIAPVMGGAVLNAPILTTIVFVVVFLSQGEKVAVGTCGPMTLGMLSVNAFVILVAWLVPQYGLVIGLISSWFGAVIFITVPQLILSRRIKPESEVSVKETPSINNEPEENLRMIG